MQDVRTLPHFGTMLDGWIYKSLPPQCPLPAAPSANIMLLPDPIPKNAKLPKKGQPVRKPMKMNIWGTVRCHPVTHAAAKTVLTVRGSRVEGSLASWSNLFPRK